VSARNEIERALRLLGTEDVNVHREGVTFTYLEKTALETRRYDVDIPVSSRQKAAFGKFLAAFATAASKGAIDPFEWLFANMVCQTEGKRVEDLRDGRLDVLVRQER